MIRKILLSLLLLTTPAFAENMSVGTPVPDTIETDLLIQPINDHSVSVTIRFHPNEDVFKSPPEFKFYYSDDPRLYMIILPMNYDNAVDENGDIETHPLIIKDLKSGMTYHYHILMRYLGFDYETEDNTFTVGSSL